MPGPREDEDFDDDLDEDEADGYGDEEDDEDEMSSRLYRQALPEHRQPVRTRGGVRTDDDMAADRLGQAYPRDPECEVDPHQDELLDEGVEETFPASDPVSVKRIT